MYIWCAIDIDEQVRKIRRAIEEICLKRNLKNPALTLPFHISLKISCEVKDQDFEAAVERIGSIFSGTDRFEVLPVGIEREGGIVWIRHQKNEQLCRLHDNFVELFSEEYGSKPHKFDLDFAYHTSLYVGEESLAKEIYETMVGKAIPERIIADSFIIGCSESGKAGEYRVIKKYNIQGETK